MTITHRIIRRRCDTAMRRSKERCRIPSIDRQRWECRGECRSCICCIETAEDGSESHVSLRSKEL